MAPDDLDNVYAIEIAAHRAPWSREIIRDCLLVHYDCRVIEVGAPLETVIAGYIICRYDGNVCHVLNICISPALQGKGHGQFLLQNVIDSLGEIAIGVVLLEVRPSNAVALHLYKKMGFQQTGIKRGYYREGPGIEDAVVLEKKILS